MPGLELLAEMPHLDDERTVRPPRENRLMSAPGAHRARGHEVDRRSAGSPRDRQPRREGEDEARRRELDRRGSRIRGLFEARHGRGCDGDEGGETQARSGEIDSEYRVPSAEVAPTVPPSGPTPSRRRGPSQAWIRQSSSRSRSRHRGSRSRRIASRRRRHRDLPERRAARGERGRGVRVLQAGDRTV